jgi:predicted oxidoreductase
MHYSDSAAANSGELNKATGLHLPAGKTLVLPVMGRVASLSTLKGPSAEWVNANGHRQSVPIFNVH